MASAGSRSHRPVGRMLEWDKGRTAQVFLGSFLGAEDRGSRAESQTPTLEAREADSFCLSTFRLCAASACACSISR